MDLRAELVVLSACETARGRVGKGEGVIGFSWAFFLAGCSTTVASQWVVNSASTTQLMIEFYKQMNARHGSAESRMAKAEVLRRAALKLMANEKYKHPFYWASFVMIGSQ